MHNIHKRVKANAAMVPHVFSVSAVALHNMMNDNADQAILISGESGAGKTECCKKLLNFFSSMAGSTASRAGLSVETQILVVSSDATSVTVRHGNAEIKLPGDVSQYDVCVAEAFDKSYDNLVDLEVFNEGIILHQVIYLLPQHSFTHAGPPALQFRSDLHLRGKYSCWLEPLSKAQHIHHRNYAQYSQTCQS